MAAHSLVLLSAFILSALVVDAEPSPGMLLRQSFVGKRAGSPFRFLEMERPDQEGGEDGPLTLEEGPIAVVEDPSEMEYRPYGMPWVANYYHPLALLNQPAQRFKRTLNSVMRKWRLQRPIAPFNLPMH
ncbi:hypothetical protein AAVH_09794 [Aphelenchoides avenae]|nr:hypothetical protein AAVH_09794 [Aphelenchus avenae]